MRAAIKNDGSALEYADVTLRKNIPIVLAAIKKNPRALQYADESLKNNKRIVLEAYKRDKNSLIYADTTLRQSIESPLLAKHERMLINNRKRFKKK